jgi:hypothetical protein
MESSRCNICDSENNSLDDRDVIDETDNTIRSSVNNIYSSGTASGRDDSSRISSSSGSGSGWTCESCTFKNNSSANSCIVCDGTRPGDTVYRETLLGNDTTYQEQPISSENCRSNTSSSDVADAPNRPYDSIRRGMILGTVAGASLALLRGRSITSGALSGAIYGALGGVLMDQSEFSIQSNQDPETENSQNPHNPCTNDNANRNSSFSFHSPFGSIGGSISGSVGVGTYNSSSGTSFDPFREMLESSNINTFQRRFFEPDADMGLDYDQLLARFGTGNQQTPAPETSINSLPTFIFSESTKSTTSSNKQTSSSSSSKVGDNKEEEDKCSCSVCMEDFNNGDEISTLPCLHRYHSDCINRWLRQSNSCPICKTPV